MLVSPSGDGNGFVIRRTYDVPRQFESDHQLHYMVIRPSGLVRVRKTLVVGSTPTITSICPYGEIGRHASLRNWYLCV